MQASPRVEEHVVEEDQADILAYGHPEVYHQATLGEERIGWYDDADEHILDDDDGSEHETDEKKENTVPTMQREDSTTSVYGGRAVLPAADTLAKVGASTKGGLKWHAQVLADDYHSVKACRPDGSLKSRRPMPQVRASDFFNSLSPTPDGRHVFTGILNGWPALTNLELIAITAKVRKVLGPTYIRRLWNAGDESDPRAALPPLSSKDRRGVTGVRVTLRAPAWSAIGYSAEAPGFAFWHSPTRPKIAYGTQMLQAATEEAGGSMPRARRVHHLSHRYAKQHETTRDKLVYHSCVLVEWDTAAYCSLIELAWWGGLGGYGGKSNWYADRDEKRPALYAAMADELKAPWRSNLSEVRFLDLAATDVDSFKSFLAEHTGSTGRFLDPTFAESADVRLSYSSKPDLMRYVLNYVQNDTHYSEQDRNCQTFAADLFALLSGQHKTTPFSKVNQIMYTRHLDWFLCDPPKQPPAPEMPPVDSAADKPAEGS